MKQTYQPGDIIFIQHLPALKRLRGNRRRNISRDAGFTEDLWHPKPVSLWLKYTAYGSYN